jgi:hypothetical protein
MFHRNEPFPRHQGHRSSFRENLVVARQSSRRGAGLRRVPPS